MGQWAFSPEVKIKAKASSTSTSSLQAASKGWIHYGSSEDLRCLSLPRRLFEPSLQRLPHMQVLQAAWAL